MFNLEKKIIRKEIYFNDYFRKFWNGATHYVVIIANMDKKNYKTKEYQNQQPWKFGGRKLCLLSTLHIFKNCTLLPHNSSKNASEMTKIFMSSKIGIRWINASGYASIVGKLL